MADQKQRYADILATGAFARLPPARLHDLHAEVGAYLKRSADKLDAVALFDLYELQFHLLLLSNHDIEAKLYLDRINDQFGGKKSQKIMVLRLMYLEATGDNKGAVAALGDDPDELRVLRRLATFARTRTDGSKNVPEYIKTLIYYLNLQPSDLHTWAELGDQYHAVGHYDRAVFCFKEVLLHEPLAYNIFYKVGLNLYYLHLQELPKADKKEKLLEALALLEQARDAFLRSVEISESYTKGWVGVYVVGGSELLPKLEKNKAVSGLPKVATFLTETAQLRGLAKLRVMALENFQSDDEFASFLANPDQC